MSLADNGGAVYTAAINYNHPAFNFIPSSQCKDYYSNNVTIDARNYSRPYSIKCDAGSYEYHGPVLQAPVLW